MSKKQLIQQLNENIDDLIDVELEIELMERFKWNLSLTIFAINYLIAKCVLYISEDLNKSKVYIRSNNNEQIHKTIYQNTFRNLYCTI